MYCAIEDAGFVLQDTIIWLYGQGFPKGRMQLKPAFEPVCVAYKPGGKRVLGIDECRVPLSKVGKDDGNLRRTFNRGIRIKDNGYGFNSNTEETSVPVLRSNGRWPANIVYDGSNEVLQAFAEFGESKDGIAGKRTGVTGVTNFSYGGYNEQWGGYNGEGSPARFFYCAKASKSDRIGSKHPTIKPVALMKWLIQLVVPKGGSVIDLFAGTGTVGKAAQLTDRVAILIEKEDEYCEDIRRRIDTPWKPPVFAEEDIVSGLFSEQLKQE